MITLLLTLDQIIGIFTTVECLVEISLLVKGEGAYFLGLYIHVYLEQLPKHYSIC